MKKLIKLSLLLFTIHLSLIGISAQTEQKAELIVQTGHSESVHSVAFSPNGKILASGSDDSSIKIWDVETGKELRTFKGHSEPVNAVEFSPNGDWIASGTIRIWDVFSGNLTLDKSS